MAPFSTLALVPLATLLIAQGAQAQGSACDQFKATLAARIDPSIRGFSLDTVSSGTPIPPGAKVVGTCEGGAYKILLRRSGGAPSPSATAAVVEGPASTSAASPVTAAASRRLTPPPASPASQPAPNSAPIKPAPIQQPVDETASVPPKPLASDVSALAPASAAAAKTTFVVAPAAAPPTPVLRDPAPADSPSLTQRTAGFLGRYWYGFAAMGLLILGPALWSWFTYHRAYDASGLPRGPRIK